MTQPLRHVLCVDDEPDILEILKLSLGEVGGLRVSAIGDVDSALQQLPFLRPDMVLLDVMMPKVNGMEALYLFRKVEGFARLPIVLMTARVQAGEVAHYRALGATDVIGKPFDPMALPGLVQEIWMREAAG